MALLPRPNYIVVLTAPLHKNSGFVAQTQLQFWKTLYSDSEKETHDNLCLCTQNQLTEDNWRQFHILQ